MADRLLENGFTPIPQEILKALARTPFGGRHHRVLLAVLRLTFGWGTARTRIHTGDLSEFTDIDVRSTQRILRDLRAWGVIRKSEGKLGIEPDYTLWDVPASRRGFSASGEDA